MNNGWLAFIAFGAVVLAVTGGEALYADMGHFGAKPIRLAWYGCVLPALTLNYLGQGALLLSNPSAISNPFYLLFPAWALYPAVGLATLATVIASQSVISGVFSMTKQAIQLGFLPRMQIKYTSDRKIGQIYMPLSTGPCCGGGHGSAGIWLILEPGVRIRVCRNRNDDD